MADEVIEDDGHKWECLGAGRYWWCKLCEIGGGNKEEPADVGKCPGHRTEPQDQCSEQPKGRIIRSAQPYNNIDWWNV